MFWRYVDDLNSKEPGTEAVVNSIPEMYVRMDNLIKRVREELGKDDVLIIMSDHGFTSFRREFNINTWLKQEGYLSIKDNKESDTEYLRNIDWAKTKAFGVGLGGIYINRAGRERLGVVSDNELSIVKSELIQKLESLIDTETRKKVIRKVYDSHKCYKGIYKDDGPDLIIGCEPGLS